MVDERDDDEIFELTEDMASIPPPPEPPSKEEQSEGMDTPAQKEFRVSNPPPRSSSPFLQIAEPRTRTTSVIPDPDSNTGSSRRNSFIPQKRDVAVLVMPIQQLSGGGTGKPISRRRKKDKAEKEPEVHVEVEAAGETEQAEDVIELSRDMMAQAPDEKATVQPEPETAAETAPETVAEAIAKSESEPEPVAETVAEAQSEADTAAVVLESSEVEAEQTQEKIEKAEEAAASEQAPPAEQPEKAKPETKDLGTPEAVFDAFLDDGKPAAAEVAAQLVEEEIDLGGMEELGETEKGKEPEKDEEEEEIDLAEAEEVTSAGRLIPPGDALKAPAADKHPKMRRRHKKAMEWWAEIFDDDYMTLMPPLNQRDVRREVDYIEKSLNVQKGGLILDLACGDGRHAVSLARRGYRVVGVDLSLPMLARAGEAAQEADQKINFIHGDMRELGFDKTFDGVYCVGTSYGYFDEKTNFKVFEGVARALKPGAAFLLEVANRDHVIANQPNLTWFEGNGCVCMEETTFNYVSSRLDIIRNLIIGENGRQKRHDLSLRLYSLHELGAMLQNAGFNVTQVAGHISTPGAFFGSDSALLIILAARRA